MDYKISKNINVAQVVYSVLDIGGAEKVAIDLAEILEEKINNSSIFIINNKEKVNFYIKKTKVISCYNKYNLKIFKLYNFVKKVKKNKINILHAHNLNPLIYSIVAYFFCNNLKIVFHDHHPVNKHKWNFFIKLISRIVVNRWITVSNEIMDSAKKNINPKNLYYIDNPVNSDKYYFINNVKEDKILRFAIVANYRIAKNHKLLIDTLTNQKISTEKVEFHCFGLYRNSDLGQTLHKNIKKSGLQEKIILNDSSNDIPKLLDRYDAGLLVSNFEGLPISLLEYMSKGLPVIMPDVGQCKSLVKNADCGMVFEKDNQQSFAFTLNNFIKNKDKWKNWGLNARQHIKKNHSLDSFSEKILKIYLEN